MSRRSIRYIKILLTSVFCALTISSCSTQRNKTARPSDQSHSVPVISAPEIKGMEDKTLPDATKALLKEASAWIGTKYRYGGNSRSGVDCSGLILQIYNNALNIKLPRNSSEQRDYCTPINKNDLFQGDLIFFITGSDKKINHVGMYMGDGKMIHSSTSKGVIISSLTEPYYVSHFHSCGRVSPYYTLIAPKAKQSKKSRSALQTERLREDLDAVLEQKTDSIISVFFD